MKTQFGFYKREENKINVEEAKWESFCFYFCFVVCLKCACVSSPPSHESANLGGSYGTLCVSKRFTWSPLLSFLLQNPKPIFFLLVIWMISYSTISFILLQIYSHIIIYIFISLSHYLLYFIFIFLFSS